MTFLAVVSSQIHNSHIPTSCCPVFFHSGVTAGWCHPGGPPPPLAGMVHSVSGWTRGVQVKLWDPLRTRAIPERFRDVFTTRRYTNSRLPLPYLTLSVTPLVNCLKRMSRMTVIRDRRQSPVWAFRARWALSCSNEARLLRTNQSSR